MTLPRLALAGALMPLLCAAQAPQSIPSASLRSSVLASAVFLPASAAQPAQAYLANVAPSSRRTFFVRPALAERLDAAFASGVPALRGSGLPDAFSFDLDGEQFLVFRRRLPYEKRETLDVWMGEATLFQAGETMKRVGGSGPAVLVAKNGLIKSGSAYVGGGGPFLIIAMSENLIAVREADAAQFREETKTISLGGARRAGRVPKSATGTLELRIAIHFTRDAENEVLAFPGNGQNIHSIISSEVATLRRSFFDAGIAAAVKILPSNDGARTSYAEKRFIQDDVVCLAKAEAACQPMLQHAVHATILVRNKSGGCGMAAHDGGKWNDASLAVAVVGWNCISNLQHGLVHELGHILGGQHEQGAAQGTLGFAKAYVTTDGKYGTLLSEMRPGMLRVPYWSTTKTYIWLNHPVGDATHNNALALSQTIPQIIKSLEQ